jgi:hypothetical protein
MSGQVPPGLREIARCQAGVVTRQQALRTGMTAGAIVAKIKYGRWRQLYRGVYATFTGPLSRQARLWAAVLYAGNGARLSHETAAELHGLHDQHAPAGTPGTPGTLGTPGTPGGPSAPVPPIHLTVPASRRVRPAHGLVIHVSALLGEPSPVPRGTLPRTPVEATVLDLVDAARGIDEARAWVTRACARGLTTQERLRAAMSARSRLRWRSQLLPPQAPKKPQAPQASGPAPRSVQQRSQDLAGVRQVRQHGVRARGQQVGRLAGASRHAHGARAGR